MDTITIPNLGVFTYTPIMPAPIMPASSHPFGAITFSESDLTKSVQFTTIFGLKIEIQTGYYFAELSGTILYMRPGMGCMLDKWNLLKSLFENKLDFWQKRYIIPMTGEKEGMQYSPACKEQALTQISKQKSPYFYIVEKFNLQQRRWLREIQSFLPKEDRCKIVFDPSNPDYIKVEIAEWWFTQPLYRLGWLLLAFRVANEREAMKENLKARFDNFKNFTTIPEFEYSTWSGSANWRKYYE